MAETYPIQTAPTEGEFLAPDKHGDWRKVQRFDSMFGHEHAVIDARRGRWWTPDRWMPLPAEPTE